MNLLVPSHRPPGQTIGHFHSIACESQKGSCEWGLIRYIYIYTDAVTLADMDAVATTLVLSTKPKEASGAPTW